VHSLKYTRFSAISGITPTGKLYFQLTLESIKGPHIVKFLKHLLRHIKGKVVILWDNIPTHRSKVVKEFVYKHRKRLFVFFTPPYAPEYNPDEGVWNQIKYNYMANFCPRDEIDLKKEIRNSVIKLRGRTKIIQGFFRRSPLNL